MGHLVPLPPWATKEQIEKRLRYYRIQSFILMTCVVAAAIGIVAAAAFVLVH